MKAIKLGKIDRHNIYLGDQFSVLKLAEVLRTFRQLFAPSAKFLTDFDQIQYRHRINLVSANQPNQILDVMHPAHTNKHTQ